MHATLLPGGGCVRWLDLAGAGEPIVFVHGLGAAGAPQFAETAASSAFRCRRSLLIDLVGHGYSDRPREFDYSLDAHADAVARILDTAGVRAVDIVGHSLGGTIAILLSQRRPDLVAGLVAIEPNLDPWDGDASVNIARQSEDEFVRNGYLDLLAAAAPAWASTLRVADPIALHRTAVHLCELRGDTPRSILLDLTIERTLLWGARSRQPLNREELAAAGVGYRLIADAGHVPMEDNPVAFVRILADTLGGGRVDPAA